MSLDPALVSLLTDTVTIASVTGRGTSGQPTYGTKTAYPARVERHDRLIDKADGTKLAVSHTIFLNTDRAPKLMDRIWLPGDSTSDNTLSLPILHVSPFPGLTSGSTSHYEIAVSRNAT